MIPKVLALVALTLLAPVAALADPAPVPDAGQQKEVSTCTDTSAPAPETSSCTLPQQPVAFPPPQF